MKTNDEEITKEEVIQQFNETLEKSKNEVLLIYDNIEDFDKISAFTTNISPKVRIILTIKNLKSGIVGKVGSDFYEPLDVEPFGKEEFQE